MAQAESNVIPFPRKHLPRRRARSRRRDGRTRRHRWILVDADLVQTIREKMRLLSTALPIARDLKPFVTGLRADAERLADMSESASAG